MPRYELLTGFTTLLIPTRRMAWPRRPQRPRRAPGLVLRESDPEHLAALVAFLDEHGRRHPFAPVWTAEDIRNLFLAGLWIDDFVLALRDDQIVGAAALWDQRRLKQAVVRGYAPSLADWRPLINAASRLLGTPRLPAVGESLSIAFVSHLTLKHDSGAMLADLIQRLRTTAAARDIEWLAAGFADHDARLQSVRDRFRCRAYASRLYLVDWEDRPGPEGAFNGLGAGEFEGGHNAAVVPEVALL
jgi:hypothetical protein